MVAKALNTPTDLQSNATKTVAEALNGVLADSFALFFKTKNFHWHMSGPHFRDYHLLLDEQAAQNTSGWWHFIQLDAYAILAKLAAWLSGKP